MPAKDAVWSLDLDHFDASTLTYNYQLVSDTGLSAPCFLFRIINSSTAFIVISYDGVSDHECLPAGETLNVDFQTNSRPANWVANFKKGQKIWLKMWKEYPPPKPLTGMIYITGFTSNY